MENPFRYLQSSDNSKKYRSFRELHCVGSKPEGSNLPISSCPSKEPRKVRAGLMLFSVRWANPRALLERIKALNCPGPHHIFSVDKPSSKAPAIKLILDCPQADFE